MSANPATRPHSGPCAVCATERLEYLRGEIRAERISYGEIAELESLAPHIEPGDVELLEWAGVPEHEETATTQEESDR